ncbi:MAG TPA: hypothetical protein VE912_22495 [Bacteroidales bacterium]|nr:hypothetical protein [Bacteroidales bacterium]
MKSKIGMLLVRGAGRDNPKKLMKFVDKLKKDLKKTGIDQEVIHFEMANWYGPTQENQDRLMEQFVNSGLLKDTLLRKFILYVVSDLVAYTGEPGKPQSSYEATHAKLHDSLTAMESNLKEGAPLIISASSLATEIISNYIWDRQQNRQGDPMNETAFQRMETLTGVFTFGSNNPLYLAAYQPEEARPFNFPSPGLPRHLKEIAYWGNFFDRNDPMGYPLRPINQYFAAAVTEDVQINSGNLLSSWNAASHMAYWNTRKIRKRVVQFIREVLEKLP